MGTFQSTPSARRATACGGVDDRRRNISIHALREEGDMRPGGWQRQNGYFNPRPPRGGRPSARTAQQGSRVIFQSTPSARRATGQLCHRLRNQPDFNPRPPRGGRPSSSPGITTAEMISIHALREEGDCWTLSRRWNQGDFNPRPPRGGRQGQRIGVISVPNFNPRPPRGGRRLSSP